ncbi:MAG: hypothetical protein ACRDTD_27505, partial [Pseudonocardiaceae bacterium]
GMGLRTSASARSSWRTSGVVSAAAGATPGRGSDALLRATTKRSGGPARAALVPAGIFTGHARKNGTVTLASWAGG